jgi:hypothetical protein
MSNKTIDTYFNKYYDNIIGFRRLDGYFIIDFLTKVDWKVELPKNITDNSIEINDSGKIFNDLKLFMIRSKTVELEKLYDILSSIFDNNIDNEKKVALFEDASKKLAELFNQGDYDTVKHMLTKMNL